MSQGPVPGRSIVTRRAIVDVVRTAVQGSYGVTGLSDPDLRSRLLRWLGLRQPGIRVGLDGGLDLDLFVTVAYGVPVAEVARQVDSAVRYGLRRAVGREVRRLTIHVGGLHYQPLPPAPPSSVSPAPGAPSPGGGGQEGGGGEATRILEAPANREGTPGDPAGR